LIYLLYNTVKF